jgi:para-nitrobenzyl esterase
MAVLELTQMTTKLICIPTKRAFVSLVSVLAVLAPIAGAQGFQMVPPTAGVTAPVKIASGMLTGTMSTDKKVNVYLGIPFAAPPVGDLRWKEPRPAAPFKGAFKAEHFGANCIQAHASDSRPPYTAEYLAHGEFSEDCLTVNVWAPAGAKPGSLPVLVWVYGGGFREGSGEVPVYDGQELAHHGVILITFNYRLGVLGFLAHPELTAESPHHASGNYGLLDQLAALRWVQVNVSAFGGAPAKVTIFGQSAGGMSVQALIASPTTKGLFSGAYALSGSWITSATTHTASLAEAEQLGVQFAASQNVKVIAELRKVKAEDLLPKAGAPSTGIGGPIVDGYFLPDTYENIVAKGMENKVAMMTTFIRNDYRVGSGKQSTVDELRTQIMRTYGDKAAELMKLYPFNNDAEASVADHEIGTDRVRVGMYSYDLVVSKTLGQPLWAGYFDHAMPYPEHPEYGAFHSGELPYAFHNLDHVDHPFTSFDRKLADTYSSYIVNFAKNRDPNGKDLPVWPAFKASAPVIQEIGEKPGGTPALIPEKFAFWNEYWKDHQGR